MTLQTFLVCRPLIWKVKGFWDRKMWQSHRSHRGNCNVIIGSFKCSISQFESRNIARLYSMVPIAPNRARSLIIVCGCCSGHLVLQTIQIVCKDLKALVNNGCYCQQCNISINYFCSDIWWSQSQHKAINEKQKKNIRFNFKLYYNIILWIFIIF